jgi:uncharacterized protein
MIRSLTSCFFLWALVGASAWAELAIPGAAPVVDEVGLLSSSQARQLSQVLLEAKARSAIETSVFIAKDMRGLDLNGFSVAVAEKWALGKKGEDKGLLFLIVPSERKMRLEVGYGLEGDVPDAFARRALDEYARPLFRSGNYYEGIVSTLGAVQSRLNLGLDEAAVPSTVSRGKKVTIPSWLFIIIVLLGFGVQAAGAALGFNAPRRYGRGGWGGGGLGGGWGSGGGGGSWGGGGGFGGGGSSSSW